VPGLLYTIEATPSLNPPMVWSVIGSDLATRPGFPQAGVFEFLDTNAPLFPMRFYRAIPP
jgi:hypothetical protein